MNKSKFAIGFVVATIGAVVYMGSINPITVVSSLAIGLVVAFLYGKYGTWAF